MTVIDEIIYQPEVNSPTVLTMTASGSLDDWKREVVEKVKEHPYLITFLSAAFAGPLLKFARQPSFGMHLFGRSSRGKTTTLQVAASVWGNGSDPAVAPDRSYIRSWNATATAVEIYCAAHNHCLLCLDESGKCEARDIGNVIYGMFGGQGKGASNPNRKLKSQRTWLIVGLSTGEISLSQMTEDAGKKTKAGQRIRMLEIPIVGEVITGPYPKNTVDALKRACGSSYGTAGPEFIRRLINEFQTPDKLQNELSKRLDEPSYQMPGTDSPEKDRAMNIFVLLKVAGMMAVRLLDLPLTLDDVNSSVNEVATAWLQSSDTLSNIDRAIISIREFILRNREAQMRALPEDDRVHIIKQIGFWDKEAKLYYLSDDGFEEACGGHNPPRETAQELRKRNLLHTNDGAKLKVKFRRKIIIKSDRSADSKSLKPDISRLEELTAFAIREAIHAAE